MRRRSCEGLSTRRPWRSGHGCVSRPGREVLTGGDGAPDAFDDAPLDAMSLLFKVLDRHARAMIATSEVMGLVSTRLNQREKRLADLFERVERCAEAMEPSQRPTWRWALTGTAWAVVGGLVGATLSGAAGALFRELAQMRLWIPMLGYILAAAPAAAQGLRSPVAPSEAPSTVTTRVRHVTTVALPETAEIVDLVVGDAERWDISAAAHLAFVRPLAEGIRSNVVLLTAGGDIVPLLLVERDDAPVDAVVRVSVGATDREEAAPLLAAAETVSSAAARATEAWASVEAAQAQAAERVEAARTAARNRLDAGRESYPRQAHFDYRWPAAAAGYPWMVEAMWHDGRRTYLRTRVIAPVLYERVEGELEQVSVSAVLDDVLHVVPRVLGSGALEVGGERLPWSVAPRKAGP